VLKQAYCVKLVMRPEHLDYYLDEFGFRFNCRSRLGEASCFAGWRNGRSKSSRFRIRP
jgi:hypothetical protein